LKIDVKLFDILISCEGVGNIGGVSLKLNNEYHRKGDEAETKENHCEKDIALER
jgi:hypothetical protein